MTKQHILSVINNPVYKDLLTIYNTHKIDNKRDSFFRGNFEPGSMQFKMLLKDVIAICAKLERNNLFTPEKEKQMEQPPAIKLKELNVNQIQRPKIDKHPHISYDQLPDNLKQLFNQNGEFEQKIKSLHALMSALPAVPEFNDKRKKFMDEINDLEIKQGANWDIIDKWYNNRIEEPEQKEEPVKKQVKTTDVPPKNDPVACSRYIERAKRYIHRNADLENKKKKQIEMLAEYRAGLKELCINAN